MIQVNQLLTANIIGGLFNANSPSAVNPFATLADVASGIFYLPQIISPNLKNDSLNTPPVTTTDEVYIVGATPTGAWTGLAGHALYWNTTTSSWTRFLLLKTPYTLISKKKKTFPLNQNLLPCLHAVQIDAFGYQIVIF